MLRIINNNKDVISMSIKPIPRMYCFGGINMSIEMDKIKKVEKLFWYGNDNNESIPILMITLRDGTKVSVDFEREEEAEEALKTYKKNLLFKIV